MIRLILVALIVTLAASSLLFYKNKKETDLAIQPSKTLAESNEPTISAYEPKYYAKELCIEENSNFYHTLISASVDGVLIHLLVESAKDVFDLAKIPAKTMLKLYALNPWKEGAQNDLKKIEISLNPAKKLEIINENQEWIASEVSIPIVKSEKTFAGRIEFSLWESAFEAGLDERTIQQLAEIFGWQIDFERQVRPNDSWKIIVEYLTAEDKFFGYGNILAAEYNATENVFHAFRFSKNEASTEYYDADGQSLKGKFLKSPLKFGRISSRFQKARFHPVLGFNRPHNGVDYAAPTGTPIRAVGDGVISARHYGNNSGNMISIRHNAIYQTAYKHLSKFNAQFKKGSRVKQGDIIGYVGATGLATGPHLHFEFYEHGKYVDPLGIKFPRENPIPDNSRAEFIHSIEKYKVKLGEIQLALLTTKYN